MESSSRLEHTLDKFMARAAPELIRVEDDGDVRCLACANRCRIRDGRRGVCHMRANRGGVLYVPDGYVAGLQVDPIEKKPFFHVYPGREALSFGMLGCNFHCPFCQNWVSSQVLKDDQSVGQPQAITPERLAEIAVNEGAPVMVSTYNEPLITSDWAAKVFEKAKEWGIVCGYVSNGHATPEVIAFLRPFMDLYKVDLKCFDEDQYRALGGSLQIVLDTIALLKEKGFWVEVVTLVVPGFNDSGEELKSMAAFIAGISRDIPWHVTAFHPDYKMTGPRATQPADLERAYAAGKDAGLRFVYSGNLPGRVDGGENTPCPSCGTALIERRGFRVIANRMDGQHCPSCRAMIPGVWESAPPRKTAGMGAPRPL